MNHHLKDKNNFQGIRKSILADGDRIIGKRVKYREKEADSDKKTYPLRRGAHGAPDGLFRELKSEDITLCRLFMSTSVERFQQISRSIGGGEGKSLGPVNTTCEDSGVDFGF